MTTQTFIQGCIALTIWGASLYVVGTHWFHKGFEAGKAVAK